MSHHRIGSLRVCGASIAPTRCAYLHSRRCTRLLPPSNEEEEHEAGTEACYTGNGADDRPPGRLGRLARFYAEGVRVGVRDADGGGELDTTIGSLSEIGSVSPSRRAHLETSEIWDEARDEPRDRRHREFKIGGKLWDARQLECPLAPLLVDPLAIWCGCSRVRCRHNVPAEEALGGAPRGV